MDKLKLNLGCGTTTHPNWQNLDIVPLVDGVIACDLAQGIPYEDESASAVYHSHVLEHLRATEAASFLRDCYRVLEPGGVLRVVVPDLEGICRAYLEALESGSDDDHAWMLLELYDQVTRERSGGRIARFLKQERLSNEEFVYQRVGEEARVLREIFTGKRQAPARPATRKPKGWKKRLRAKLLDRLLTPAQWEALAIGHFRMSGEIHQWMYDKRSLQQLLSACGFEDVQPQEVNSSEIPHWIDYALDLDGQGRPRKPDSLYMEARRPIT